MTTNNPHCESQWPYSYCKDYSVANLLEAASGAHTIANLLQADRNIAHEQGVADETDQGPVPFAPNVWSGLHSALNVCLNKITEYAEQMEREVKA